MTTRSRSISLNQALVLGSALVAGTVLFMSPAMAWMRADLLRWGRRARGMVRPASSPAATGSEKGNGVERDEAVNRMVSEGGQA